eukprot:3755656-Pleurochrysis_carterae.AAC.1
MTRARLSVAVLLPIAPLPNVDVATGARAPAAAVPHVRRPLTSVHAAPVGRRVRTLAAAYVADPLTTIHVAIC